MVSLIPWYVITTKNEHAPAYITYYIYLFFFGVEYIQTL